MGVLLPFLALYRRHWLLMSFGVLLSIVTLCASIGLLSISGWFLAGSAIAGLMFNASFNYMLPASGVRGSAIFRTAGRYAERLVSHDATFRVLAHLRVFTFSKILPLSPSGMTKFRQGELLNRLVADVDTLDHLYLRVLSPLISAAVIIAILTCGLSFLDMEIALTLGAILLALLILVPPLFYLLGRPIGQEINKQRANYRSELTSWLQGNAELTIYNASDRFLTQLSDIESQWQQQQKRQASLGGLAQALMIFASGITVCLMLWLTAVGIGGNTEPGALIALFTFASLAAFEAMLPVAGAFQHMGQVISSATRVKEIIDQKPTVTFPEKGVKTPLRKIELSLDNVSFSYPEQSANVLNQVSLTLRAGEHVALLGQTGCGKSTLLQLLTRAWDVNQGDITLNGKNITRYDEATLRKMMVVVTQRVHVFTDTVRDNLLLANDKAKDKTLERVLKNVGLETLLEGEGLDGWLGEGGRQLSGGEQRRLGIARALLSPAPLMLLDEPTEGLDAETEHQILQLIHHQCSEKTLLLVTHRLHGLEQLDRICVMDSGKIIEQGSHQELIALQGRYAAFRQRLK